MSEQSQYPYGRDWTAYSRHIEHAKRNGRRYGYGRDSETGAIGLFVEWPMVLRSGRISRCKEPALMRSTGRMRAATTKIVWKQG